MLTSELNRALYRAQRRGKIVRDSGDKAIELFPGRLFTTRRLNGARARPSEPVHEPPDHDGDHKEQSQIDGVPDSSNRRTANRFAKQEIVSDATSDGGNNGRTSASDDSQRDDQDDHQVFEYERRQREPSAEHRYRQRKAKRDCVRQHIRHPECRDTLSPQSHEPSVFRQAAGVNPPQVPCPMDKCAACGPTLLRPVQGHGHHCRHFSATSPSHWSHVRNMRLPVR
jgi:hypothetical protein